MSSGRRKRIGHLGREDIRANRVGKRDRDPQVAPPHQFTEFNHPAAVQVENVIEEFHLLDAVRAHIVLHFGDNPFRRLRPEPLAEDLVAVDAPIRATPAGEHRNIPARRRQHAHGPKPPIAAHVNQVVGRERQRVQVLDHRRRAGISEALALRTTPHQARHGAEIPGTFLPDPEHVLARKLAFPYYDAICAGCVHQFGAKSRSVRAANHQQGLGQGAADTATQLAQNVGAGRGATDADHVRRKPRGPGNDLLNGVVSRALIHDPDFEVRQPVPEISRQLENTQGRRNPFETGPAPR